MISGQRSNNQRDAPNGFLKLQLPGQWTVSYHEDHLSIQTGGARKMDRILNFVSQQND